MDATSRSRILVTGVFFGSAPSSPAGSLLVAFSKQFCDLSGLLPTRANGSPTQQPAG